MKKYKLLVLSFLSLFLTGCSVAEGIKTIVPTATFTSVSSTAMLLEAPTSTLIPTSTLVPTATFVAEEKRINPIYVESVSKRIWGVTINVSLITDKSFSPSIKQVSMNDEKLAEFVARTMFRVWWKNGKVNHIGAPTEKDLRSYMELWSGAQKSGDPVEWEKVEFTIYANDLNDGNGIAEKPYKIWLMYDGVPPNGVKGVNNINFILLNGKEFINISFMNEEKDYGYETVIDNNILQIYCALSRPTDSNNIPATIGQMLWVTRLWLVGNNGHGVNFTFSWDNQMDDFMKTSGIKVR